MKKVAVFINTGAQAHFYSSIIRQLELRGYDVRILARGHGLTLKLLDGMGFRYFICARASKSKLGTVVAFLRSIPGSYCYLRRFKPHLLVGGPIGPLISVFLRRPCLVFTDGAVSSVAKVESSIHKVLAKAVLTPTTFEKDLGKKHVRIQGYKELAYLHPNYFAPDPSIYRELGIRRDEKYVILRFNALRAVHDIGRHGFSPSDKYQLVRELGKYAKVFISTEGSLPEELEPYKLPIHPSRIHHALYYAQLLVCDTGTMATEAAVLGTPVVMGLSIAPRVGNFKELQQKYDLIYCFQEPSKAIPKAVELIQQADLEEEWAKRRQRLLADKIDVAQFMVWFIENYPESLCEFRKSPGLQKAFM